MLCLLLTVLVAVAAVPLREFFEWLLTPAGIVDDAGVRDAFLITPGNEGGLAQRASRGTSLSSPHSASRYHFGSSTDNRDDVQLDDRAVRGSWMSSPRYPSRYSFTSMDKRDEVALKARASRGGMITSPHSPSRYWFVSKGKRDNKKPGSMAQGAMDGVKASRPGGALQAAADGVAIAMKPKPKDKQDKAMGATVHGIVEGMKNAQGQGKIPSASGEYRKPAHDAMNNGSTVAGSSKDPKLGPGGKAAVDSGKGGQQKPKPGQVADAAVHISRPNNVNVADSSKQPRPDKAAQAGKGAQQKPDEAPVKPAKEDMHNSVHVADSAKKPKPGSDKAGASSDHGVAPNAGKPGSGVKAADSSKQPKPDKASQAGKGAKQKPSHDSPVRPYDVQVANSTKQPKPAPDKASGVDHAQAKPNNVHPDGIKIVESSKQPNPQANKEEASHGAARPIHNSKEPNNAIKVADSAKHPPTANDKAAAQDRPISNANQESKQQPKPTKHTTKQIIWGPEHGNGGGRSPGSG